MNYKAKTILETLIRVKGFSTQTGIPTNARATSLFGQVDLMITAMESAGTDQASGRGEAGLGTERKHALAEQVRDLVRAINRTVKGLDDETHPNAAAQFPMPRSASCQALLATARAFLEHIAPIKADLIASGLPADFDETLQGLVADFTAAIQQREGGMGEQVGGTRGLFVHRKNTLRLLQKLDATMSNLLKADPVLLGNWKRTVRVQRAPRGAGSDAGAEQTGGQAPVTASAPAGGGNGAPTPTHA
jgi:hypothetical protein